ncbi:MAG: hypothetical protein EBR82_01310 [Caulobacteraceae bacterium]|nr:hypothetical protein [Caulobacteraceae bacterium]
MNLDILKEHWGVVAKIAACLAGIIGTFLITPPLLSVESTDASILYFAQFVLAILVGLFFVIPSSKVRDSQWRWISLAGLVIGICLFFAYVQVSAQWTALYKDVGVTVIGGNLTDAGKVLQAETGAVLPGDLIFQASGDVDLLWPRSERLTRYLVICGLYTVAMISLSVSAMAMIEFVRIRQAAAKAAGG